MGLKKPLNRAFIRDGRGMPASIVTPDLLPTHDLWIRVALIMLACVAVGVGLAVALPRLAPDEFYFPRGALDSQNAASDQFRRGWYSAHLRAMGESSLSGAAKSDATIVRFTWLRTFHHPISIRVERGSVGARLVAVELSGTGGYEPGKASRRVDHVISETDAAKLFASIDAVGFWARPQRLPQSEEGMDGARWIFEGRRQGQYQVLDLWSPQEGPLRDAGLFMLRLAGLSAPQSEVY